MKEIFFEKILELGLAEPRLYFLTGDVGFGFIDKLQQHLGNRVVNVGSAEQSLMGIAAGIASQGKIPVVYSIGGFPTLRCLEQIRNDVCYHRANVKIVAMGGGLGYGAQGMSHHVVEDLAVLRTLPHLHLLVPGDDREARDLTEAMVSKIEGPCYLRLDKTKIAPVRGTALLDVVPFLPRVVREGRDVVILGSGGILECAFQAADTLQREGHEARIISVHGLRPLATHSLTKLLAGARAVFTLEEHVVEGGLGGAISEWLAESGELPPVFHRFGIRNGFLETGGDLASLRARAGISAEAITEQIRFYLSFAPPSRG